MARRRKVCFVLPSLNGGGAERAAVQILNGLDPNQWDRSMFLFAREGPYLAEVDPSIVITSADTASRWGRWRALRSFVARERPDLVMAFLSFFSALSAVRAAHTRAKVVFNLQTPMSAFLTDADYHWRRSWHKAAFAAVARVGYAAADLIIATSHGVARDLTTTFGIDPDHIRVLANPVDVDRVRAAIAEPIDAAILPPGDAPLIVAAGRLAEAKNYPLMIDAFAMLRQRMPARLCILAKADVFLLTSRYEGFGNVLIEAMALAVPVVATASAGTRDIVDQEVDGLLVDSHTPEAVAAALRRVLENRELRASLSCQAAASAEQFSAPRVIARYDQVLKQVAA